MSEGEGVYKNIEGHPWLEPLRSLLNARNSEGWGDQEKGMLRCLMANGFWSQARLHDAGYECSRMCECCQVPCTLFHILWRCQLNKPYRDQYGLPHVVTDLMAANPDWALWTTGITKCHLTGYPKSVEDLIIKWDLVDERGGYFNGIGFGDGSGQHNRFRFTRRCGWSALTGTARDGQFIRGATAYGPLPGDDQVVPLAELFAFMVFLKFAGHPTRGNLYHYNTDCTYIRDGFHKGASSMTDGWAHHANIWREVFRLVEDLGGADRIRIHWIKAHLNDCSAGDPLTLLRIRGNRVADIFAKLGTNVHPHDQAAYEDVKRAAILTQVTAKYIAKAAIRHVDGRPRPKLERVQKPYLPNLTIDLKQHQTSEINGRSRCKRCLKSGAGIMISKKCSEVTWAEYEHRVAAVGDFLFCSRCSCFTQKSVVGLAKQCKGPAARQGRSTEYTRLCRGMNPYTGEFLGAMVPLVEGPMDPHMIGYSSSWGELFEGMIEL